VNFFCQGGSSRPEATAEGRETSAVKEETCASCIVLNFSYYEAPTFYNVKKNSKNRAVSRPSLDLGSQNHSNSFYKLFIFRLQMA
jgi:hypothetical protein